MDKVLKNTITDLVSSLLYYDRKEDEDLPRGEIERMVIDGETSAKEMTELFGQLLADSV